MGTQRLLYLDVLKLIAIYFVVVIHTIGFKVGVFELSLEWFVANFFSSLARFAIPVFIMCSGAVFLGRNMETLESVISFYKKYIPLYAGYLFLGLVVAKGLSLFIGQDIFLLKGIFYDFYTSFGSGMWFFFMFIGLVLVTPILQRVVANRSATIVFLILWLYFCIFKPLLCDILKIYYSYVDNMLFASYFVGYFVLGYFLSTTKVRAKNKALLVGGFIGVFFASVASLLLAYQSGKTEDFFYYSNNPFVLLYTVCLFCLFKNICGNAKSSYFMSYFSRCTPFVYIFHTAILSVIPFGYSDNIFVLMFVRVPAIFFIAFFVSFVYIALSIFFRRFFPIEYFQYKKSSLGKKYAELCGKLASCSSFIYRFVFVTDK